MLFPSDWSSSHRRDELGRRDRIHKAACFPCTMMQTRPPPRTSSTDVGLQNVFLRCFARSLRCLILEFGLFLVLVVLRIGLMKRGACIRLSPRQCQSARGTEAGKQRTAARCPLSWPSLSLVAFLSHSTRQDKAATGRPLSDSLGRHGRYSPGLCHPRCGLHAFVSPYPPAEFLDVPALGACPWRARLDGSHAFHTPGFRLTSGIWIQMQPRNVSQALANPGHSQLKEPNRKTHLWCREPHSQGRVWRFDADGA